MCPLSRLTGQVAYDGAFWALVQRQPVEFGSIPELVNISLLRFVLAKIDTHAAARNENGRGVLARPALVVITVEPTHVDA